MKPKFLLGGALILMSAGVIIMQQFAAGAQYFLTVSEVRQRAAEIQDQPIRISGAVIGDTIQFNAETLELTFAVVDSVEQIGFQQPLTIRYIGPRPELLQDHAQAIAMGKFSADGVFQADDIQLKCPTRYEEQFPDQVSGN